MTLDKELYMMAVGAIINTNTAMDMQLMAVDGYTSDGRQATMCVAIGDDAAALLQWVQRQRDMRTVNISPQPENN